jgi:hypothetical protein
LCQAAVAAPVAAQEQAPPPKGPAPRFITVQRLDAENSVLIVSEECLPHPAVVSRTITKKQKNRREEPIEITSSIRPHVYYYTTTHKLPLKRITLYGANGKKLPDSELSRLKPGTMILMSADGYPVEPEYLALVKPETVILVVEVQVLPSPFESLESTEGIIKKVHQPAARIPASSPTSSTERWGVPPSSTSRRTTPPSKKACAGPGIGWEPACWLTRCFPITGLWSSGPDRMEK